MVATDDHQLFRVSFRDQTEEIEAWLTQAEVIEQSENRPDSWLFVNDDIWDETLLLDRSLPHDCKVTFIPRDVSQTTYMVYYSDACGGSRYFWTKGQIVEQANHAHPGFWVFVGDQLATVLMIAEYGFQKDTIARFTPGLVGGPRRYSISVDGETKQLPWEQIVQHMETGFELFLNGVMQREPDHSSLIAAADEEKPIQLRSDLVEVLVGPAEKVLMRRCEYERIVREFNGSVLAMSAGQTLRNGGIDTLCSTPDNVFEGLWSGAAPALFLIARAC